MLACTKLAMEHFHFRLAHLFKLTHFKLNSRNIEIFSLRKHINVMVETINIYFCSVGNYQLTNFVIIETHRHGLCGWSTTQLFGNNK